MFRLKEGGTKGRRRKADGKRQIEGRRQETPSDTESPSSENPPSDKGSAFRLEPEKTAKKLKEGWIKSWMMIEALAVTEQAVRGALENHVRKMGLEKNVIIAKKDFKKTQKVDKPFPNIESAYSSVVELEVLTKDYDKLVFVVLNYAPSAIEVLEPKKISMDAGEAQGILNSLAEMLHKFVSLTHGGLLVDTK